MAEATVELICETCGRKFVRRETEYKYSIKKGRKCFCSLKCVGNNPSNIQRISSYREWCWTKESTPSKPDKYSDFRLMLRRARRYTNLKKSKNVNMRFDIDLEYLYSLWDKQQGKCPYTGWDLTLKDRKNNAIPPLNQASLDRIDSNLGYVKGNVQFVSIMYNYAKNQFTDEDVITFVNSIHKNMGLK